MKKPPLQDGEKYSIYIIGPYTGNEEENVKIALQWANELLRVGFMPFVPHLSHYWHLQSPKPYEFWIEYSIHTMILFDAVFRIPGESKGADIEEEYANYQQIPVFKDLQTMIDSLIGSNKKPEVARRSSKPQSGFSERLKQQLGLFDE